MNCMNSTCRFPIHGRCMFLYMYMYLYYHVRATTLAYLNVATFYSDNFCWTIHVQSHPSLWGFRGHCDFGHRRMVFKSNTDSVIQNSGKEIHGGSGRFRPRNARVKRALENPKRAPENRHRMQCKNLFNVANILVNGMWKVAPENKNFIFGLSELYCLWLILDEMYMYMFTYMYSEFSSHTAHHLLVKPL